METLWTEVLVVGGGTGGTAAAIQAARRGVATTLVSEFSWLGGMLTAAGVSAPDGNELIPWQTGLWGAFLRTLETRHPNGLDQGWVSFFNFDPVIGAAIFSDWVTALPNLNWIAHQTPQAVLRQGDRVVGVQFSDYTIYAQITLDATELGDVLALGDIPYRWGWEAQRVWQEHSAPIDLTDLSDPLTSIAHQYSVQAPTWVVVMQDFSPQQTDNASPKQGIAPKIALPDGVNLSQFEGAWANHGKVSFMNYGRLPGNRFMMNWPIHGNDYGRHLDQLIADPTARQSWHQAARNHSQGFAYYIQQQLGQRYGLAQDLFPKASGHLGGGAFALMPYYRESRRLQGITTVTENHILPMIDGVVAALPCNQTGAISAIAIGNYANDHHYPGVDYPLQPKSIRWGGRWTGTPFTIPYEALIPDTIDGLLVCEKNLSVSHIANGSTRLQPIVMLIGQAAGMAAALCIETHQVPRTLPVQQLQQALLTDPTAPAAVVPLFNLSPHQPIWQQQQQYYLNYPEHYPKDGWDRVIVPQSSIASFLATTPLTAPPKTDGLAEDSRPDQHQHSLGQTIEAYTSTSSYCNVRGLFHRTGKQQYGLTAPSLNALPDPCTLVTLHAESNRILSNLAEGQLIEVMGWWNAAGSWLRIDTVKCLNQRPAQ